jgi:hypothetical protein
MLMGQLLRLSKYDEDELEGAWGKAVMTYFEVVSWHSPEGPNENLT